MRPSTQQNLQFAICILLALLLLYLVSWNTAASQALATPTPEGMWCITPTPTGDQWCMIPPVAVTVTPSVTPVPPTVAAVTPRRGIDAVRAHSDTHSAADANEHAWPNGDGNRDFTVAETEGIFADCEDAMIDQLCDEQLLIAHHLRNARRRGDFVMVSQYMRCWQVLDRTIKEVS